jgi:hypothetical protein
MTSQVLEHYSVFRPLFFLPLPKWADGSTLEMDALFETSVYIPEDRMFQKLFAVKHAQP